MLVVQILLPEVCLQGMSLKDEGQFFEQLFPSRNTFTQIEAQREIQVSSL